MRALPVGSPRSWSRRSQRETCRPTSTIRDICMMYSVCDIAGINQISARILSNGARAVAGMARRGPLP